MLKFFRIHVWLNVFKVRFERVTGCVKVYDIEKVILYIKIKYTFYKYMVISTFPASTKIRKDSRPMY